jgi:hypothetical protein
MFSKFRTPFWNPGRFHDRKHSVNKVPSMRELENLKPIFIKLYDGSLVCLDRKILKCTEGSNPSLSVVGSERWRRLYVRALYT